MVIVVVYTPLQSMVDGSLFCTKVLPVTGLIRVAGS